MGSHQHTKMGEGSKQVRVDNWGIFFLQRLQMFFNKTDYCDLTLQFEGNVQLKVHRLVMNACTEYFRALEQNCEIVDDVLVMPADLQADVVLPIVNFMYTGMLEFHMSMFDKLYKTAHLMNITVLTKLLDAQKVPISPLPKPTHKKNMQIPHTWNLQGKKISAKTMDPDLPAPLPGRKIPVWKRKSAPSSLQHGLSSNFYQETKKQSASDSLAYFDNAPKPTRFEWPDDDIATLNVFGGSFDDISYTSKPLMTKSDEPKPSTSFDSNDSNRLSPCYDDASLDTDDMKDYVKEQRIRSGLTDDYYDGGDELGARNSLKRKSTQDQTPSKKVRFNTSEKENQKGPKISITPTGKLTSDVDHTKIISEVLKKYPNLVKKNKNIRLKILSKRDNVPTPVALEQVMKPILKKKILSPVIGAKVNDDKGDEGPWRCSLCSTPEEPVDFVLYYLFRKHMADLHHEKFDSRMCKYCGYKTNKSNLLIYHQYTRHGVKPPPQYKFPKCNSCPYIALSESLLLKHKMNHGKYELQCLECKVAFINQPALTAHSLITGHNGKLGRNSFDCQYCTKKFHSGSTLFTHIKTQHRDEARRDGIVSIDEMEDSEDDDDQAEYIVPEIRSDKKEKVKILSNVKLSSMETQAAGVEPLAIERSSEADSLNNVASGIATSLGLVDVVVLDENDQYILQANNQQSISQGESEFILPDLQDARFTTHQQVITSEQNVITQSMLHNTDITSTDELVMVLTDHDYGDGNNEIMSNENSNIVVLYSHPIEGQENQFITSQGNIMLTSQAGIIELRNTNAVVSSTASFVNSSQIESIEMIQREINQHPGVQVEQELPQDMVILNDKEKEVADNRALEQELSADMVTVEKNTDVIDNAVLDQELTTDMAAADKEVMDDTELEQELCSDMAALADKEKEVEDDNVLEHASTIENVENSETDQPQVNQNENEVVDETIDVPPSEPNDLPLASIEAVEETVDNTIEHRSCENSAEEPLPPAPVDDENTANPEGEDIQENQDSTHSVQEEDTAIGEMAQKQLPDEVCIESGEQATEETAPINNTTETDLPIDKVHDEATSEEQVDSQEKPTHDDEQPEEAPSQVVHETDPHMDTPDMSQSSEAESPRENSQDKPNGDDENTASLDAPSETISETKRKTFSKIMLDKSAKIILEDWEDTDSQQSDTKSTNVNKLIDDWDDDEDERKN
uniref:Centrosome-associated zinc finger protein CP190 n=1 Tax=Photinus pyralis TaxID=7054 RepID=A0A1Y1KMM1_PHOPY